jgi:predicted metal-dependent HD superfamily phosphohydrolase
VRPLLRDLFYDSAKKYCSNLPLIGELWLELEAAYSSTGRFYHNLSHLNSMVALILPLGNLVRNGDAVTMAIFYHDLVYDPLGKDNEEESARRARNRLEALKFPDFLIKDTEALIRATKMHQLSDNEDINYFIDADLSILGSDPVNYQQYAVDIRREYRLVPDLLYKPGRRKVLERFLSQPYIFKTPDFRLRFEDSARINLERELNTLK